MQPILRTSLIALIALLLANCTSGVRQENAAWIGYRESGEASFYAMKYQFRSTASGERLNQLAKTAAHRQLPFGTRVRVTNVRNGESVVVRVNDRGPFIDGRIIDLTRSAFASIGNTASGIIDVEIEVIN